MHALLQDKRVRSLFDTWGEQTGLYRLANTVAKEGRSVACAAGVSDWTALANPAVVRLVPALEPHVEQFEAAVEAYLGTLGLSNRPALDPVPAVFASDVVGLPWDWLPYDLLNAFFRAVHVRAFGPIQTRPYAAFVQSPRVAQSPLIPSGLELRWQPAPAERVSESRARPNRDGVALGKSANWFYRARVKHPRESVAGLAHEHVAHCRDRHEYITMDGARRAVQIGIREAERLLSLGSY